MKQIYINDAQYEFLKKIAISHGTRVSSLVQIAVDLVYSPVILDDSDLKLMLHHSK